jgi:hypothetical protein
MGGRFSFSTPTELYNLVNSGISDAALAISGGDQTTILNNFSTGSTWPTLTQLNTAENFTRNIFDGQMNTARATKSPDSVALVNAKWDGLCGFRCLFDVAKETVIRAANHEGGL